MIFLFTDYGLEGPYIGQVETVLHQLVPNEKVIHLMTDAPRNKPKESAYLLSSLISRIPQGAVLFCVVDPGVGSGEDKPVMLKIDGRWYVGADNGLFDIVARHAKEIEAYEITWQPKSLSNSFHGRDIYAPVCAMIVNGEEVHSSPFVWLNKHHWPDDLNEIIYIDHFGNCMTGIRASSLDEQLVLRVEHQDILNAKTFSDVKKGKALWYENSNGMIEIAVNQGSAAELLELKIGCHILLST
jgi:S-adenosylmethionine hydrolase